MLTEADLERIKEWANRCPYEEVESMASVLLAEVRELHLILRDALQDDTPGNRVWREGVKAGLEAAAKITEEPRFKKGTYESILNIKIDLTEYIRSIDPATILPKR